MQTRLFQLSLFLTISIAVCCAPARGDENAFSQLQDEQLPSFEIPLQHRKAVEGLAPRNNEGYDNFESRHVPQASYQAEISPVDALVVKPARSEQSPPTANDAESYPPTENVLSANPPSQSKILPLPPVEINEVAQQGHWWTDDIKEPLIELPQQKLLLISLDSLIHSALVHSKQISVARIDGFVEQEKITQQDATFDWSVFVNTLFTSTNQQTGSGLDAGVGNDRLIQQDFSKDFGLKRTNHLGGQFEATQNLRALDSNSLFTDPDRPGFSELAIRYNQPLLRDGGRLVNYGQVIFAQLNAGATMAESEAEIVNVLTEVVQAYWELYRLRSRYVVQKELVAQIRTLLEDISQRKKIDAQQSLIGQAESELSTQLATLAQTRTQLAQAQHRLIRAVGDRSLTQASELIPSTDTPRFDLEVDPQSALTLALQHRPEIRAAVQRIHSAELLSEISEHQLKPGLALILEASANGVNGDFEIAKSFGDQFSKGGPSFVVGLNYDLPFGNRAANSRLRESRLLLAREVANMEDVVDQVRLEVFESVAGLRGASRQFGIRNDAIDKSDVVVRSLLRRRQIYPEKFDQVSQLYVREILDAQQRKAAAELAVIDLQFDFAVTTIQLRKAMGTLLARYSPLTESWQGCSSHPVEGQAR